MSQIINPFARQNVQISDSQRMCVLVHRDTKRILCFARDDPFARSFQNAGYEVIEIKHAYEFDNWAKKLREQSNLENQEEEFKFLQREAPVRNMLRKQLKDRLDVAQTGAEKITIQGALNALEAMEQKRKRVHESYMLCEVTEGAETKSDIGEHLAQKIINNE